MGKGSKKNRKSAKKEEGVSQDWIAALARKEVSSERNNTQQLSKAERIAKRAAKKQQRQERKSFQKPIVGEHQKSDSKNFDDDRASKKRKRPGDDSGAAVSKANNCQVLEILAKMIEDRVSFLKKQNPSWKKPYTAQLISNSKKRKRNVEEVVQPRISDYGGIGLARPSLWIPLDDPSWQPKLEEEFAEHIPGFFGKQRTKAMKKQTDGKMLWRQLQKSKDKKNAKVNGKKLSDMSPDERVEAMIKAGMI